MKKSSPLIKQTVAKIRKTRPTLKQRVTVDKLVELGGKSVSLAMREARLPNGEQAYSDETARNPQKLTESKGFKELCEERGLTDNLLVDALVSDIKSKKGKRVKELELGFKVKGKIKNNEEPDTQEKQTLIQILNVTQNFLSGIQDTANQRVSEESLQELLR